MERHLTNLHLKGSDLVGFFQEFSYVPKEPLYGMYTRGYIESYTILAGRSLKLLSGTLGRSLRSLATILHRLGLWLLLRLGILRLVGPDLDMEMGFEDTAAYKEAEFSAWSARSGTKTRPPLEG